jgi:hypothetical protein
VLELDSKITILVTCFQNLLSISTCAPLGAKILILKSGELLSNSAFNFNLWYYIKALCGCSDTSAADLKLLGRATPDGPMKPLLKAHGRYRLTL